MGEDLKINCCSATACASDCTCSYTSKSYITDDICTCTSDKITTGNDLWVGNPLNTSTMPKTTTTLNADKSVFTSIFTDGTADKIRSSWGNVNESAPEWDIHYYNPNLYSNNGWEISLSCNIPEEKCQVHKAQLYRKAFLKAD